MKFHYKQTVRVTNGFYFSAFGIVHEVSTWPRFMGIEPRYRIFIGTNCFKWLKESDLEAVKENSK